VKRKEIKASKKRKREGKTDISRPHHAADLLHRIQVGAQAAVHREDLLVNDGRYGQAIEAVRKRLPQLDVVAPLAFVIKAVDAVDRRTLVVAAQHKEVFGVLDLVCQQQADRLERLFPPVDVIAQKEVVRLGREAAVLKQAQQVVVLTVYITTNLITPKKKGEKTFPEKRKDSQSIRRRALFLSLQKGFSAHSPRPRC
jgi:hypothetical protein